jgi:hypothetical protein
MTTQSIPFPLWKTALSFVFLLLVLSDYGSSFTIRREHQTPRISISSTISTRNDGLGKKRVSSSRLMSLSLSKPKSLLQQRSLIFPLGATTTGEEQGSIVVERECRFLDEKQLDFIMGYLNKHHEDLFTKLAENFSQIGVEKAKKNAWSGGAYQIQSAKIVDINTKSFELDVDVKLRSGDSEVKRVAIDLGKSYCCCCCFERTRDE